MGSIRNCVGMLPVLIAVGIVSSLATMSLVLNLSSSLVSKKLQDKVNRREAFYTNEMAAWHLWARNRSGTAPASNPLVVDNAPYLNISQTVNADAYSSTVGQPLNVATTQTLAPSTLLIRRYNAQNLEVSQGPGEAICSKTNFSDRKKHRLCLSMPLASPPIGSILMSTQRVGPGDPWTNTIFSILPDGQFDTQFGVNGLLKFNTSDTPLTLIQRIPGTDLLAVASRVTGGVAVWRFNDKGEFDSTFGVGGSLTVPFPADYGNRHQPRSSDRSPEVGWQDRRLLRAKWLHLPIDSHQRFPDDQFLRPLRRVAVVRRGFCRGGKGAWKERRLAWVLIHRRA